VQVTGASASYQSASVDLAAGSEAALTIRLDYMVGDNYPYTGDMAGTFGDNTLNTLDLIDLLRAVTDITGFVPQTCSDRFDAMDAYPVDTATTRGGDGILNTLDLITVLQRVTNIDPSRPRRVARGITCTEAGVQARKSPTTTAGSVEIGSDGSVYLIATKALSLDGLAVSISSNEASQLNWSAAEDLSPALTDTGVPGSLAVAWMHRIELPARGRLLLGTVAGGVNLTVAGASANSGTRDIQLGVTARRGR
jgi:hypothetical protein